MGFNSGFKGLMHSELQAYHPGLKRLRKITRNLRIVGVPSRFEPSTSR